MRSAKVAAPCESPARPLGRRVGDQVDRPRRERERGARALDDLHERQQHLLADELERGEVGGLEPRRDLDVERRLRNVSSRCPSTSRIAVAVVP